jgi:hypothetical protein
MSGRKVEKRTIADKGRDQGKTFVLTEMPATKGEKWATRVLLAVSKSGADIPMDALSLGMAGVALVGLQMFMRAAWEDAEPLLDEMMTCIQIETSAGLVRSLIEEDIEEIATRLYLRSEVFELHTGFSVAASLSTLGAAAKAKFQGSPNTETSPGLSEL